MVFAAGYGKRLAPLTDALPKALVEIGGVAMLERVAVRLVAAGVTRIVVNVCPHADAIETFVRARHAFGVRVVLSREAPEPLETGGGLVAARPLLGGDGPLLLHNVDIHTDLSLRDLLAAHRREAPLGTLAVMDRRTTRHLLFDDQGLLGRVDERKGLRTLVREAVGPVRELGFAGVHVVEREFLDRITERGRFSVLDPYLRLAAEGARILPFRVDGALWIDVGRPADLARADAAVRAQSSA